MTAKQTTEGRLDAALQRLLSGKPTRVKASGKLTLNKINNEAGLGHSYIHKFQDFVEKATVKINEYNSSYRPPLLNEDISPKNEVDSLKLRVKKEKELKEKYRNERDDALIAKKQVEAINATLMFRLYELQEQVQQKNVVSIASS